MLDVLGVKFQSEPIYFTPGETRYYFNELHLLSWVQRSSDPDQNDLSSDFVPPRAGISLLRERVRAHQSARNTTANFAIVYAARDPTKTRSIVNDQLLVDAITKLVGKENFYVSRLH